MIEHKPFTLPPESLRDPKRTDLKLSREGRCRMCGRTYDVRPLTRHHLIPVNWWIRQPLPMRSYRNAHANIVPLCREDHDLVDSKDDYLREESRRMLRRLLSQQEVAFIIAVRGREWMEMAYPAHSQDPENVRLAS